MLDKQGRLFGKINIIDMFIVLAIIFAVLFLAKKILNKGSFSANDEQNVTITFYSEEVPEYIATSVKIGDRVEEDGKKIFLGIVTDNKLDKGFVYSPDANGVIIKSYKEGYSCQTVTAEIQAQVIKNGILVNGNQYGIGYASNIWIGQTKYYYRISSIKHS